MSKQYLPSISHSSELDPTGDEAMDKVSMEIGSQPSGRTASEDHLLCLVHATGQEGV